MSLRILTGLFLAGCALRLWGVYPPPLDYDTATIALQACQILDGERPIFWTGQAYMGTAGAYLEAGLFTIFGKNTLVLSLLAWALSCTWLLASLLLAERLFGRTAAIFTALFWLVPTPKLLYWSANARTDRLVFFVLTPVVLLLTHEIVRRHRARQRTASHVLLLGVVSGFAAWHNMAIAPCLLLSFAVLALHLRGAFWKRALWAYAPAWLAGFSPVIAYGIRSEFDIVHQVGANRAALVPMARNLAARAFPGFWGMPEGVTPATPLGAAQVFVLGWVLALFAIYGLDLLRRWRRREDLLPDQLTAGLLVVHPLVLALSSFGASLSGPFPLIYLLTLYGVAFTVPAAAIARRPPALRAVLLLPLVIFAGNNLHASVPQARAFLEAWRTQGLQAIWRFPDPRDHVTAYVTGERAFSGYAEGHRGRFLNLTGLHRVVAAHAYAEQHLPYALAADAARDIFWVQSGGDLAKAFEMIGCSSRSRTIAGETVFVGFRRPAAAEELVEPEYTVRFRGEPAPSAALSDRRIDTGWGTRGAPSASSLDVEFPRAERLAAITLVPRDYRSLPSGLLMETSLDGTTWETRARWDDANVFFWSVRHPFLKVVKPRCEIRLSPSGPARFLRVVIAPQGRRWTLSELFVYRETDAPPPEVSPDAEIDAIARELAPLRRTHQIVGDHYFMSLFASRGFDVEFLPNQYVDNHGRANPALRDPVALDFSRRLCLIVPKSHAPAVARRLAQVGVPNERRIFGLHELFVTAPASPQAPLAWWGIDLLGTAAGPRPDAR